MLKNGKIGTIDWSWLGCQ